MVYGGIYWLGVSVGGMGESQGGVLQQGPNIPLSGLMVGYLGEVRWLGSWGEGRGDHAPCAIVCICHSLTYHQLSKPLGWFKGSVLPIGHVGPVRRNHLNENPLLGWGGPIHCVGLEVGGRRFGSN